MAGRVNARGNMNACQAANAERAEQKAFELMFSENVVINKHLKYIVAECKD